MLVKLTIGSNYMICDTQGGGVNKVSYFTVFNSDFNATGTKKP